MWIRELATGWERVYKPSEHASARVTRGTRDAVPTGSSGVRRMRPNRDRCCLTELHFNV
jgi:hypothetical protein